MSIRGKLLRGSASELAVNITEIITGFVMLPYLIRTLGEHYYGMWLIVGTILGYFYLLNFGFSTASQRYIAKYKAQNNLIGINRVLTNSLIIFSIAGLAALFLTLLIWYLPILFTSDMDDVSVFRIIILLMGCKIALTFPSYGFLGIITSNLRNDVKNAITIITLIVRTAAIFVWVSSSKDIVILALITCLTDLVCVASTVAYAISLQPGLAIRREYIDKVQCRELFRYSTFTFIIWLSDQLRFSVDNLVIAANLSLSDIAIFNIPVRVVCYANQMLMSLFSVLTPLFTLHHATGETVLLKQDMQRALEFSLSIGLTLGGGIIVMGDSLVVLWVGKSYPITETLLWVLACIIILDTAQGPMISFLYATNNHKIYAGLNTFDAIMNFALSLSLVGPFGLVGVALGTVFPMLITKIFIQPIYVCNLLAMKKRSYYFLYFKGLCWVMFSAVIAKFILARNFFVILGWGDLVLASIAVGAVMLTGFYYLLLSDSSRKILISMFYNK